ncbi:LAMI_0F07800g1_1 [Lachancea mirantina]|uniref:LAMI_0F07800g1_1 n=1 Tax=Lachancea mirantina TaxID=1230905 RepID=A0A1G4JZZ5_9SACH|nr:LAMI_0F07800g1_1 [Lachancea mirantina]
MTEAFNGSDCERIGTLLQQDLEQSLGQTDAFVEFLITNKALSDLNIVRQKAIEQQTSGQKNNSLPVDWQKQLANVEYNAFSKNSATLQELKRQHDISSQQRKKKYSVDFDAVDDTVNKEEEEELELIAKNGSGDESSLAELRSRLLGKNKNLSVAQDGSEETVEKAMQVQNSMQEELIGDMTQLVSSLRQGAAAFQTALQEDTTVLKATEIGLQTTSKSLSTLGGKLKKYHNSKFGLLFYLGCILFMIVGLLLTYMIVKIFPKM